MRDIITSIPQGRDWNGDNTDSVKEVFSEFPLQHQFFQIFIGSGDHPDVDVNGGVVADPLQFLFLENTQQLCLGCKRHVADLIKEDAAGVGGFKAADPAPLGAGKCPFDVPKQFTFQQALIEGCAVHLDEGGFVSFTQFKKGSGHQLFPGTGFAVNEDGRIRMSRAFNKLKGVLHHGRGADHAKETGFNMELLLKGRDFLFAGKNRRDVG